MELKSKVPFPNLILICACCGQASRMFNASTECREAGGHLLVRFRTLVYNAELLETVSQESVGLLRRKTCQRDFSGS